MFGGICACSSSDSNSSGTAAEGAEFGTAADTARGSRGGAVAAASVVSDIGRGGGAVFSSEVLLSTCSDSGVSSTVECLPVVQGGISKNSSNVKTRGLQHFQPIVLRDEHAKLLLTR